MTEYDEDRELTTYVWDHCQSLMTEFERRVGRAIIGRRKFASYSDPPELVQRTLRRWGEIGVPEIDAALAEGPEAFRQRVVDRLVKERAAELFVNRCPRCGRIVRTPKARQCFWCGWDWHEVTAEK